MTPGLNRHDPGAFNPDRKDHHWGKRKLARDASVSGNADHNWVGGRGNFSARQHPVGIPRAGDRNQRQHKDDSYRSHGAERRPPLRPKKSNGDVFSRTETSSWLWPSTTQGSLLAEVELNVGLSSPALHERNHASSHDDKNDDDGKRFKVPCAQKLEHGLISIRPAIRMLTR